MKKTTSQKNTTLTTALILLILLVAPMGHAIAKVETNVKTISIGAYNVENLFDTVHDEGKRDWEFLPKNHPMKAEGCGSAGNYRNRCLETDWIPSKLRLKLRQIAKVFAVTNERPDILALEEVENAYVVTQLARELGYEGIVFEEGPDSRGIDVALLYRPEAVEYLSHRSERVEGVGNTRNLLGVFFKRKNSRSQDVLGVYVNHWPSQAAPAENRVIVARALKDLIRRDKRRFGANNLHVVAMGDFNTVDGDSPHPFHEVIFSSEGGPALLDAITLTDPSRDQPPGTSFYPVKMNWDHLDRIFLSQNLRDGEDTEAVADSFRILWHSEFTYDYYDTNSLSALTGGVVRGVPLRYNFDATSASDAGFSDHLPLMVDIRLH